ncbi:MAG: response regulator transcription factor [Lachnospiraceae bacterium]|nr:response regulator transcription factor [Lachnospiraceae bacterium]
MRKIGILEDDKKLGEELKYFLETNGYEVRYFEVEEYVGKPESFLVKLLLEENLHLLLLDIGLPRIDGSHVCKAYRAETDSPVIMITSNNSEMTELLCITNGADDFVPKPFNPQILLARIEMVMKRVYKENAAADEVTVNTANDAIFTIDYARGKITSGDESKELSKNELQIMKILVQHQGEIVSREDIIDYLWDNKAFVDDNTLTVNMTRIKGKLESIGITDAIVTKRGMGYQLV